MVEQNQYANKITAKVKLQGKHEYLSNSYENGIETGVELTFSPNYSDGKNAEWAKYTPSLTFKMTVKKEVAERFEIGYEYEVTFKRDGD